MSQNKLHWYITVRPAYEMTDQHEITALCAVLHASRTLLRRHSHQRERWSTKRKMTTYHLFVACIGSNDDDASYRSIPFDVHVFVVHPRR